MPATQGTTSGSKKRPDIDSEAVKQEASKAANVALSALEKAQQLKDAASATADPSERQKLMEQAIDAQVEAESFGKTAKYLRSGAFQGLAVGTGLGVAPGATLGALTGTLVGGVASTITGGLGAGIGAVTGALHGPFWNLGEMAGKGIQKATGINAWGWKASEGQKKTLEKMVGQIKEEDMPGEDELERLKKEGGESWTDSAKRAMPGTQEPSSKKKDDERKAPTTNGSHPPVGIKHDKRSDKNVQPPKGTQQMRTNPTQKGAAEKRKQPRKLEVRSRGEHDAHPSQAANIKKQPRKLEKRSM